MITTDVYDQYGRKFTLQGLPEDYPTRFELRHTDSTNLVTTERIREPAGWDDLKLTLERDREYHGVNYEYTDDKNVLEFDGYSGRDYLQAIFRDAGEDATVLLRYGFDVATPTDPNALIVLYEGRLVLSGYKRDRRKIQAGLERSSLGITVRARWDTPVNLFSNRDLDGADIPMQPYARIPLLPQALGEKFSCTVPFGKRVEQTFPGDTNGHVWIQFDTSAPETSEIVEFSAGRPMGLSELDGPLVYDEWLFKLRSAGQRRVQIALSYRLWCTVKKRIFSLKAAKIIGFALQTRLVLIRADNTQQVFDIAPTLNRGTRNRTAPGPFGYEGFSQADVAETITGTLDTIIDTQPGDKLYLFGLFSLDHNLNELAQTQVQVQVITQKITITGQTTNKPTVATGLPIYDAINGALWRVTGKDDVLRSSFYGLAGSRYGADGCGAMRILTGGYHLRNFVVDRSNPLAFPALTLSLQELIGSLQTIDGIGVQYAPEMQTNNTVVDTVRMEPVASFYRPVELMRIDSVSEYKEESIPAEFYNKVVVGYEKYVDEGAGAIEECFTRHEVALPLKHESGTLTATSKLVASSLAIEKTRREQFTDTPKDSTTYDESVFIIQCKPFQAFTGAYKTYGGAFNAIVEVPEPLPWLTVDTLISLSGGPYTDYLAVVTFVSAPAHRPWTFYISEPVDDAVIANGTIRPLLGSATWAPETGADLDSVTGLSSSDTTYNLRLTPGRLFLKQAYRWGGCLLDKPITAVAQKTKTPQNGNVTTRLPAGSGCDTPGLVVEKGDVSVGEIMPGVFIRPRIIRVNTRLTWQQLQTLRLAHLGLLPPEIQPDTSVIDRNYGYIVVPDESGVFQSGHLTKLTWSPADEKAVLELRATALHLGDTQTIDCALFAARLLSYLTALDEATRQRIEYCRYGDFDAL